MSFQVRTVEFIDTVWYLLFGIPIYEEFEEVIELNTKVIKQKINGVVAKGVGFVLKKELMFVADSMGSMLAYQPKAPKGLEKFEKKC